MGRILILLAAVGVVSACSQPEDSPEGSPRVRSVTVVASYPHDPDAFTEGLVMVGGDLYESTGLYGESTVRRVRLETGEVLAQASLESSYFGEGLAAAGDSLIQLTWREGAALVWERATLGLQKTQAFSGEGWGLAYDGTSLIASDGSATLQFLDPETLTVLRELTVTDDGQPVTQLNELELVGDELLANVWQTARIARIALRGDDAGHIKEWLDLSALRPASTFGDLEAVANGIAYDSANDQLFVTGKRWPLIYEIR